MRVCFILLSLMLSSALMAEKQPPLYYQSETIIKSSAEDLFSFSWHQTIDFLFQVENADHAIYSIIFKRMRGKGLYKNQLLEIDTDNQKDDTYEGFALKELINHPFLIELNPDCSIKKKSEDFLRILELTSGLNDYVSEALLEQLVSAILVPKRYDANKNILQISLYYPLESKLTLSPNLALQKKGSEIFFDQELEIKVPSHRGTDFDSLKLYGDISGQVSWDQDTFYSKSYYILHQCNEKNVERLFASPLELDYSFSLKTIDCD
ncbi:MAG: hypothetical protein S4CHLAM7_12270 [Chlamydiae bacterium]|nr:hypothetical protein [Chlamydiota bacterium]